MHNMPDRADEPQEYEDGSIGTDPEDNDSGDILEPFDPTLIRVTRHTMTVDLLMKRLRYNELDLSPDFQREKSIWNEVAQSRLIESLLIRIPIPAFYFDATNDEKWLVVDGVQRLTAFARFVMDEQTLNRLKLKKLALCNLEFLTDFNGKTFDELERTYQRRIDETEVTAYTIDPGTPPDVKFNIFKRINTGGLPLSPQEIRHALNVGPATELLVRLSKSETFLKATNHSIRDKRRAGQECILRFIAFTLSPHRQHTEQDFDFNRLLNDTMARMNKMSPYELAELENKFTKAMDAAHKIFGESAFQRVYHGVYSSQINGALFDAWSVNLGQLSDGEISKLIEKKGYLINAFQDLLMFPSFTRAISKQARRFDGMKHRFRVIEKFIEEILQAQDPWKNIEEKYPFGEPVRGRVIRIDRYWTWIEIEKGVIGWIPPSELSWTTRLQNPRELLNVGDEIDVVMLEIDLEKSRIWLSYKQTKPDPWELVPAKYKVGSVVRGKIVKIISYGAFAELEEGIEGLIHISRIAPKPFVVEKVVTLGKEYNLKVVALDVKTRRISLSLMEVPEEQSSTVVDIGTVYNDSQATEEENPEDGD